MVCYVPGPGIFIVAKGNEVGVGEEGPGQGYCLQQYLTLAIPAIQLHAPSAYTFFIPWNLAKNMNHFTVLLGSGSRVGGSLKELKNQTGEAGMGQGTSCGSCNYL